MRRAALTTGALVLALSAATLGPLAGAARAQPGGGADMARLRDALQLTPAQSQAWNGYMNAVASGTQSEARRRAAERLLPSLTTPRRLALISATLSADLADFQRQAAAVNAFYVKLTPAQQKTFDDGAMSRPEATRTVVDLPGR